jgi:hypothetical protein
MQPLTRNEFLELLRLSSGAFDQLQHAGHVALAFGTPLPATPGGYLDLDLVAMAISLGLSRSLGREIATTIVASFFHRWAAAVGQAEADPKQDYYMAIGIVGQKNGIAKKGAEVYVITHGTLDQIANDVRDTKASPDIIAVNVSDIIRRLRGHAQAAGIDLLSPFFFPPGDPRFEQILTQVKRERDARIARFKQDKKKFAASKTRSRRQDFSEPARFKSVNYPISLI